MLKNMRKTELLVPASCLEVLKTAVIYGADAVYIGGEAFGLRAKAKNFTPDEMREGIAFAHSYGKKVYVTVNILAHNEDLAPAGVYLKELGEMEPDALIIADPGIFTLAKEICPQIEIHISTQANNTNYEGTHSKCFQENIWNVSPKIFGMCPLKSLSHKLLFIVLYNEFFE